MTAHGPKAQQPRHPIETRPTRESIDRELVASRNIEQRPRKAPHPLALS